MSENERVQPGGDNVPEDAPGNRQTSRDAIGLWTGILAGPILWFVQQQICFVLVPWACEHGGVNWLHAVSAACLGGTLAAGAMSLHYWRRERADAARAGVGERAAGEQRVKFMAGLGVLSSVFFALVIIAQDIPNFVIDPCQR